MEDNCLVEEILMKQLKKSYGKFNQNPLVINKCCKRENQLSLLLNDHNFENILATTF